MKKLKDLLKHIEYEKIIGNADIDINNINYDSRLCSAGTLFAALRGSAYDGHAFISNALALGANAIICEEEPENSSAENAVFIIVKNSRIALAQASHAWFDFPSSGMKIIGVTGTNGKTTITFLLKSVFEASGKKCGIIGTTGIFVGSQKIEATHTTPESLELANILRQMADDKIDYVFIEVSSHALNQGRAASIDFSGAIFTNLTHDHLDYHKTVNDYAVAKKILFKGLKENTFAIVNGDDGYSDFMIEGIHSHNCVRVGRTDRSGFIIENEYFDLTKTKFDLIFTDGGKLEIETKLTGRFNIDNAAASAVAGILSGLDLDDIKKGLYEAEGAPGRMQKLILSNGAIALVDYAHTPDALEKALLSVRETLNNSQSGGKLICVFGCGGDRDKTKRPKMGAVAALIADIAVITDDNPRTEEPMSILDDITAGIKPELINKTEKVPNRSVAIARAKELSRKGDILLIAGKGHETYQIIGKTKFHFDDFEELAK